MRTYKSKICYFLALIMLLSGMCFETIKVHSCFECAYEIGSSLLKTQPARPYVQKSEIMETSVARSLPVMRQRPGNTMQVRRDWRISVTLLVAMAAYIAILKFYSTETAMVSKDTLQHKVVLNYIHKTDGKK